MARFLSRENFLYTGIVVVAVIPALLVLNALDRNDAQVNDAMKKCTEAKATRAVAKTGTGVELQANRGRPTLAIALADKDSASDTIAFSTKDRKLVPTTGRARTSAILLETPRRTAAEPFDGVVGVRADPWVGGTLVQLRVCVDRGGVLKAGAFQGTVRVYGPKVDDFDYAVIVTEKWPWEFAVAILWYAGLAFVIVAWRTGSLSFGNAQKHQLIPVAAGIGVGIAAMVPTFFGAYWNNATWGSDPGTHVAGLATAGLTAALAGLAAAHKFLGGPTQREVDEEEAIAVEDEMQGELMPGPPPLPPPPLRPQDDPANQ